MILENMFLSFSTKPPYLFFTLILCFVRFKEINAMGNSQSEQMTFSTQNVQCIEQNGMTLNRALNNDSLMTGNSITSVDKKRKRFAFDPFVNVTQNAMNISKISHEGEFEEGSRQDEGMPWFRRILKVVHQTFRGCRRLMECYRGRLLRALDRAAEADSVKITEGVFLIKNEHTDDSFLSRGAEDEPLLLAVARRVLRLLETHALRVRLGVMGGGVSGNQGRIGHHGYKHAFPMMVGSFMLLAAIMVPMGFQFLAVVGGKALVLSQIALFMAAGGMVQRFFGQGAGGYGGGGGGVVQHDYYLREDLRPWHRAGAGEGPQQPQNQLSHQQLQAFLNHQPRLRPQQE